MKDTSNDPEYKFGQYVTRYSGKIIVCTSAECITILFTKESSFARINSDEGPAHNPLWYRVLEGYVHSGGIQGVCWEPQAPRTEVDEGGALFEVCVPYTRSYRKPDPTSPPVYRLYYQSTAWVLRVKEGTDGRLWYCLLDDLLKVEYFVQRKQESWFW